MRRFLAIAGLSLLLAVVPMGTASPGSGTVAFDGVPTLSGTLSGVGTGEVMVEGEGAQVTALGTGIGVRRVFTERTYTETPSGGEILLDTADGSEERWDRASGTIAVAPGAAFRSLFWTQNGGQVVLPPMAVADATFDAHESPRLVIDTRAREHSDHKVFTYQAEGPRFHLDAASRAQGTGAFSLFVEDAIITFTGPDGEETWTAGAYRETEAPRTYREGIAWFEIRFADGTFEAAAEHVSPWLADPILTLTGTMQGEDASGEVRVADREYRIDDRHLRLGGVLELRPVPSGTLDPKEPTQIGVLASTPVTSEGTYSGSTFAVDGDVTEISLAGTATAFLGGNGGGVVAAAGIVAVAAGAAVALSPGIKWSLLSLLAPLYAKTQRDRLLDNHSRERIYQAIRTNPGVNLSRIHRLSDLGWGVTVYHLKMLEKGGLVFSVNGARDRCFFESTADNRKRAKAVAALANKDSLQRVAKVVADEPHLSQSDVVARTAMSQRAVSYSLKRLVREGLVGAQRDGVYVRYDPQPDLVAALAVVVDIEDRDGSLLAAPAPVGPHVTA